MSAVQHEPAISTHISPPSKTSLLPPPSQPAQHGAGFPVLNSHFLLASYFTHDRVYMSTLLSQFVSLSFILCVHKPFCVSLLIFYSGCLFLFLFFLLLSYMHHSYMWILPTKRTNLIGLECRIIYVPEFLENDTTRITGGNLLCSESYSKQMLLLLSSESYINKCCCSVTQSYPTLCDRMDCSTPSFPVIHYLLVA